MQNLPLWQTCRCCAHLPRCHDPFAYSGLCPHPNEAHAALEHPLIYQPQLSHLYAPLLSQDGRAASIFHRWRRGLVPTNQDYLYLRDLLCEGASTQPEAPYNLLRDILNEALAVLAQDTLTYHLDCELDCEPGSAAFATASSPVVLTLTASLSMVVQASQRAVVEAYSLLAPGAEWTRLLLDQVRLFSWGLLNLKHRDFSTLSDEEFRTQLEAEWSRLLHFQDTFYGFRVIPRISPNDLVRYTRLPRVNRDIRGQISTYLTHQATEYPQLGQLLSPRFNEAAFEQRLREIYRPLIQKTVRDALRNLAIPESDATAKSEMEAKAQQAFDEARREFHFHLPRENGRLLGRMGVVGLPQSAELRQHMETALRERNLQVGGMPVEMHHVGEVGFAHFVQGKLRTWVARNYPADAINPDVVSSTLVAAETEQLGQQQGNLSSAHVNTLSEQFVGTDQTSYLQRRAAARFYGVSEDQLRNWDRNGSFPARRAREVLSPPFVPPLKAESRLYPRTEEARGAVQELKARKATRSTQAKRHELTRTVVAKLIGVPAPTLLLWEQKGLLHPERRGQSVIYSQEQFEQARLLKIDRQSRR